MLSQVLHEIENLKSPITVRELSQKLRVEPNALDGMIEFLVRKGFIQNDDHTTTCQTDSGVCSTSSCDTTSCVFIAKMPKTYSTPQAATYQKLTQNHDQHSK